MKDDLGLELNMLSGEIADYEKNVFMVCRPVHCYTDLRDALDGFDELDTVIDIGAHYGSLSLLAAQKAKRVIAVEPFYVDPLVSNIYGAEKEQVIHVLPVAVRKELQKGRLRIAQIGTDGVAGAFYNPIPEAPHDFVRVMSFRSLFSFVDTVDYLKIDIEGGEYNLFDDDRETRELLSRVRFLDLECHGRVPKNKMDTIGRAWRNRDTMQQDLVNFILSEKTMDSLRFRNIDVNDTGEIINA